VKRHHQELNILTEMNLTNLMDTAFILLIAFLLVAPVLKHGIEIDLPKVSVAPISTESKTVTIVITRSPEAGFGEQIYVEDERISLEDLDALIQDKKAQYEKLDIMIEVDKTARYDIFAQVLARLKNLGVENIGLPTEPESLPQRK
jgi:biopolymer transport protein ExbD